MYRHAHKLLLAALLVPMLDAQQPQVLHEKLSTEPASHGLAERIVAHEKSAESAWLAYSIPVLPNMHFDANYSSTLDLTHEGNSYSSDDARPSTSPASAVVLLHVEHGAINRVRLVDTARILDTGTESFFWITGVTPADSIHELSTLVSIPVPAGPEDRLKTRISESALFAIAAHSDPAATTALVTFTAPTNPINLRDRAAFWLAVERGHDGFLTLRKQARDDADAAYRKKLTFDLTLVKEPAALDEIIRMAHSDTAPEVRKQAQFWMANKGGKKVAGDLSSLAESDPDTAVRKQAVFAVSRLPDGEATTHLIEIATTSKDPAVREQAVFWLGQSKDPKALDYLTSLIKQ